MTAGWTHVVGLADGAVLFYRSDSGDGATAVVGADGHLAGLAPTDALGAGWTLIAGS